MACSICMYSNVFSILAWPRNSLTSSMFFVWWYRLVAFQRLKVWKLMRTKRGFCSFSATPFRIPQNTERITRVLEFPKTSSTFLGNAFSMLFNLALTFHILGLLLFPVRLTLLCVFLHLCLSISIWLLRLITFRFLWAVGGTWRVSWQTAEAQEFSSQLEQWVPDYPLLFHPTHIFLGLIENVETPHVMWEKKNSFFAQVPHSGISGVRSIATGPACQASTW